MENQMTSLRCRKCGAVVNANQKKCAKCGAPILLKVMMEEEKRHLSAKEIREKDKRMRQEYDKMSKEKEERRKKDEKKQQKSEERKARAQAKTKAELDAIKEKEERQAARAEEKQAKAKARAEAKAQKPADAAENDNKGSSFPVWAVILIIVAVLAAGALAYYFTRPSNDEGYTEPEVTEEVVEEALEETAEEPAEEPEELPVEEPAEEPAEEEAPAQAAEEPPAAPAPEKKSERNITRNNYLFPSDTEYLTESDLNGLSSFDTGLIRNEIFARKGYVFKSEPYKSYFNSQAWYTPNPSAKMRLNDIERYNKDFILDYERSQGWR